MKEVEKLYFSINFISKDFWLIICPGIIWSILHIVINLIPITTLAHRYYYYLPCPNEKHVYFLLMFEGYLLLDIEFYIGFFLSFSTLKVSLHCFLGCNFFFYIKSVNIFMFVLLYAVCLFFPLLFGLKIFS